MPQLAYLPLIVVGTMNLTRTVNTGEFYCPACARLQSYRVRSRRPYMTFYFLPLIPLGARERILQCLQCRQHWDEAILEPPFERSLIELAEEVFHDELLRASVLLLIENGEIGEQDIVGLMRVGSRLTGRDVDREELGQICSSAYQNKISVRHYFSSVQKRWTPSQQRTAMQTLFMVASLGEQLDPKRLRLLDEFRQQTGMTEREFEAAIEAVVETE